MFYGMSPLAIALVILIVTVALGLYLYFTGKRPAQKAPGNSKKVDAPWMEPKLVFRTLRYDGFTFEVGRPVKVMALDQHGNVTDKVLGLRWLMGFTSKSRAVLKAGETTVNRSLRRLRPYATS